MEKLELYLVLVASSWYWRCRESCISLLRPLSFSEGGILVGVGLLLVSVLALPVAGPGPLRSFLSSFGDIPGVILVASSEIAVLAIEVSCTFPSSHRRVGGRGGGGVEAEGGAVAEVW